MDADGVLEAGRSRPSRHVIMHFTHIDNLPGILAAGLRADTGVRDGRGSLLVTEAADLDIKARRRVIPVPLPPYGYVADYVPFYFAARSPMLYKLFKGSVPGYTDGQDPLIYLVATVESISAAGLRSLFSDGNCAKAITMIYDDLSQLDVVIDWPVMRARMWQDTADDPDRMRRRMAEFLVHERVPVACLAGIAVRTEPMRDRVERVLAARGTELPVRVRQSWYF